jgi:hypothetical protein
MLETYNVFVTQTWNNQVKGILYFVLFCLIRLYRILYMISPEIELDTSSL